MDVCSLICPKTWLHRILFTSTAALFSLSLYGQAVLSKHWEKSLGGKGDDFLWEVKATSDGGVIMGGSSNSSLEGGKSQPGHNFFGDIWVIKLDAQGNKQWDKTIGGNNGDEIRKVLQTADGGYVLFGESWSDAGGDKTEPCRGRPDFWLVKLDANGKKLWDKTYGGSSDEIPRELAIMPDGGFLLTGESLSGKSGDKSGGDGLNDYWLVRTDSKGNKLWDKTLEMTPKSEIRYFSRAGDAGFLLGGFFVPIVKNKSGQEAGGHADFWVIKFDVKGNEVWNKHYGPETSDFLMSLEPTPDGGYILGGKTHSQIGGKEQPEGLIMKLDGNGTRIWEKTIGSPLDDNLRTIQPTPDKGYVDAGYSGQKVEGSTDMFDDWAAKYYWVTKLDANGKVTWEEKYESSKDQLGYLLQTPDKGFLLSGSYNRKDESQSEDDVLFNAEPPRRIHESWVTKLDPKGKKQWHTRIRRKEHHTYDTPELTKDGGFVLWGQEFPEQDEADYWIVKFGPEGTAPPANKPAADKVSGKAPQSPVTPPASPQEDNPDDRIYAFVQQEPSFPGGQNALNAFLANSIKYPPEAKAKKKEGRVVVSFVVGKNGEIKDLTFLRGLSPEIDAEATRVVKSMPAWIPGKQNGKVVNVRVTIPIIFRLDAPGEKK